MTGNERDVQPQRRHEGRGPGGPGSVTRRQALRAGLGRGAAITVAAAGAVAVLRGIGAAAHPDASPSTSGNGWRFTADSGSMRTPTVAGGTVTGTERWRAVGKAPMCSPAVADGAVYIGSVDHNLYAFDAADGSRTWKFGTGSEDFLTPAVANGLVYYGGRHLFALDPTDIRV